VGFFFGGKCLSIKFEFVAQLIVLVLEAELVFSAEYRLIDVGPELL
jgi:hypothetical protein